VRTALEEEGFVAIGLDHFAHPDDPLAIAARTGHLRRNFQGYTIDQADALLPLGESSIGLLPQGFVGNAADLAGWRRAIEADLFPVTRGLLFSREDRARGEIIERLMCDVAVDYGALALDHGFALDAFDSAQAALADLAADGVVELSEWRVTVTTRGQPFLRLAAAALDACLAAAPAHHTAAA
jgi:oxygen-independent coproporphyrinogen-3 oxidase